jgi:hypothetical protein
VSGVERCVVGFTDDPARRVELREALGEHGEPSEVLQRRIPAQSALSHERWAIHATEDHVVAADVRGVGRVAGLHVELAGRLRHLGEYEVRVELDEVALDLLTRRTK